MRHDGHSTLPRRRLFGRFTWRHRGHRHTFSEDHILPAKKIALVGNPNVGKSVLFNALTGSYVSVSNYPGTTVEVYRGKTRLDENVFEVIDTPGMYSLSCITDEERVTRNLLLKERPSVVLHVMDAKSIKRMLPLTLQLIEASLPVILVLNMMDEAEREGLSIEVSDLEKRLGVPVVTTIAALGKGIDELKGKVSEYVRAA